MNNTDRKRSPQFTENERQLLVCCIIKEPDVESRKLDGKSNRLKKEAWERVAKDFNSHTSVRERDPECLRKCWANMKGRLKKTSPEEVINGSSEGILSLLKSSSNLIVTLENSSDDDQDDEAEFSHDGSLSALPDSKKFARLETIQKEEPDALNVEYCDLDRSVSPSLSTVQSERSFRPLKSPSPAPNKSPNKGSKQRRRGLLARVAEERLKYISWKREQKGKLLELKIKTQQALLDEAIAKRDLAQRELSEQTDSAFPSRKNGT